jgi:predicted outer membrane protein
VLNFEESAMKRIGVLSFALVAILTTACSSEKGKDLRQARVSDPAPAATGIAPDVANQDARDFIRHVAAVNNAEIDLGKLAVDRGTAEGIKKFARMMIDDHTASGDKLKALATDLKIETSDQLDDRHTTLRDKIAKESGADFDREYASAMVEGHKDLIDQLEPRIDKKALEQWKAATNGKAALPAGTVAVLPDPSQNPTTMRLNQFAADIYPTVHAHLEAAKALESALKQGGGRR